MNLTSFIEADPNTLFDARSEAEYEQGHIPGAINTPLLNNDQRKLVGTCYKKEGHDAAVKLGYKLVGDQFTSKAAHVKSFLEGNEAKVYCWRGGLRSKIFTELLEENGLVTERLQGGYKIYRNWVLKSLEVNYNIVILGGPTGCGKTDVLHEMAELGEQIIDLEGLANHKGSVYGGIGKSPQISNEQFENELVQRLHKFDASKPIWIENESRLLGRNKVPDALFEQMRSAPVMQMDLPMKDREQRIMDEYAGLPKAELIASTQKLEKRIGNKNMNDAVRYIEEGSFIEWIRIVAKYYDKMYAHGSSTRDQKLVHEIQLTDPDPKACADKITDYYYEHFK